MSYGNDWKIKEDNQKCVMIPNASGHLLLFLDTERDAKLVSAAPDLLKIAMRLQSAGVWPDLSEELDEAISKARGSR